jgi:hypothetical protein
MIGLMRVVVKKTAYVPDSHNVYVSFGKPNRQNWRCYLPVDTGRRAATGAWSRSNIETNVRPAASFPLLASALVRSNEQRSR